MEKHTPIRKILKRILSYILVATLASAATWCLTSLVPSGKLDRLAKVIDRQFIAEADQTKIQDAAAEAMITALGDRWSYYISAEEYADHLERQKNEYVGIGVTVMARTDGTGYDVVEVNPDGPAAEAGVAAGDIITHADGTFLGDIDVDETRNLIMGKKNTQVILTVLRNGETLEISVTRKVIRSRIVEAQMLSGNIGYIRIANFHGGAAKDAIREINNLTDQGAEKLIFDVRGNPGGYVHEMVDVLDHLLPEGILFQSVDYKGREDVEESDGDCLQLPMAVLINGKT